VALPPGTRDRLWSIERQRLIRIASGAAHRSFVEFDSVVGIDMGVRHPWGVQLSASADVPDWADATKAELWASDRANADWVVDVPLALVGVGPWKGFTEHERMGMYATTCDIAAALPMPVVGEFVITDTPTYDQVIAGYGGWMDDVELAELLVTAEDLAAPDRVFLVGLVDDRPVGCAFVWTIADTRYLSGIGVVEGQRGRGYGLALTTAAAHHAAVLPSGEPASLVWMHATADGAALYSRIGFELVDTEVQLGLPDQSAS
jgi:ribosomal protein S18 acetylase RimI-like enzyme